MCRTGTGTGSAFGGRGKTLDLGGQTAESLPEMLALSARRYGNRVALDFFGAETTYAELVDHHGSRCCAVRSALLVTARN